MSYALTIWAVANFVESRVKKEIDYTELEKITGFSYRHIREVFKENTDISLSKYILERRIANAAFDINLGEKKLTDIAFEYKFNSYDAFTRAFKRVANVSPSDFKKQGYKVGRQRILMGMYAPVIYKNDDVEFFNTSLTKLNDITKESVKTEDSCILYGVPKIAYSFKESTPFPIAFKACLSYLEQSVNYTYLMAVTGASFRLRWNKQYWDGGNVDIMNIYEDPFKPINLAFKAAKRDYKLITRQNSNKQQFIDFIKQEINEGKPVISFGVIGPGEAGIISGYKDNGKTLIGWNLFQDGHEFAKSVDFDECGYYICHDWWENPETIALLAVGNKNEQEISQKEIIKNAINIMSKENIDIPAYENRASHSFAGGQLAYDFWANAITNEEDFTDNTIVPLLIERLMCQNDAQTMIGEGRAYAAYFIEWVGNTNEQVQKECKEAAKHFRAIFDISMKMCKIRGGFEQNEKTLKNFCKANIRAKTAELIHEAKAHEQKACELMKEIYNNL